MNKQTVIDALERMKGGTKGVVAATISDCQRVISAMDDDSGWIPVSDRKPDLIPCKSGAEFSEVVMILTSGRKVMEAVWDGVCWTGPFGFWEAWGEKVTHWMPLPELPKEVSDGETE